MTPFLMSTYVIIVTKTAKKIEKKTVKWPKRANV